MGGGLLEEGEGSCHGGPLPYSLETGSMAMVCLGTASGVLVFRPGSPETEWELVHHGLYGQRVTSVAETDEGTLLAGVSQGMVHLTQDWRTWKPHYEGLEHTDVTCLALDPEHPGRVYAGTAPAALYLGDVRGRAWSRLSAFNKAGSAERWTHPEPPHTPKLLRLFRHGRKALFAAVQHGGVVASFDEGQSWEERSQGLSGLLTDLRPAVIAPERLYATTDQGFYRSENLGKSWTQLNQGLPHTRVSCLAVSHRVLVLAVNRHDGAGSVLFHSTDAGEHWRIASADLSPDQDHQVTAVAPGVTGFYAGTGGGLVLSSDDGSHWNLMLTKLPKIFTVVPLRGQRTSFPEAQQTKGELHEE